MADVRGKFKVFCYESSETMEDGLNKHFEPRVDPETGLRFRYAPHMIVPTRYGTRVVYMAEILH